MAMCMVHERAVAGQHPGDRLVCISNVKILGLWN